MRALHIHLSASLSLLLSVYSFSGVYYDPQHQLVLCANHSHPRPQPLSMFSWAYRCLAPSTSKVTHVTRFYQITFIPSQSISFDHFTVSYILNRCLNSAQDSLFLIDGQLSMASHVVSLPIVTFSTAATSIVLVIAYFRSG